MRPPRHRLVPNANDPRRLGRLLELLATGLREPRSLAQALDCDVRTVHYYTQAGEWLGFLEPGPPPRLSPLGLEWVYAPRRRRAIYARAVAEQPDVQSLMAGRGGRLPDVDEVTAWIKQLDPRLSDATARRRASAVRGLVAPGLEALQPRRPLQLELPFGRPPGSRVVPPREPERSPCSLDHYLPVAMALLDWGELDAGQVRAVLDAAGFAQVDPGGVMAMAVRRGDARRIDGRLVVTPGALGRREAMTSVIGLALSDPDYRAYLADLRASARGDLGAVGRLRALRQRFADWDRRLYRDRSPAGILEAVQGMLLGRPLERFPIAGDPGEEVQLLACPFLEATRSRGLLLTAPSGLALLADGLDAVNRMLDAARRRRGRPHPPTVAEPVLAAHGRLLHPGEPPPPAVPDRITLRLHVLGRSPLLALVLCLLLFHRRGDLEVEVVLARGGLRLLRAGVDQGDLFDVAEAFFRAQGWWFSRPLLGRPGQRLDGRSLRAALRALGVAVEVGGLLVLDDAFFQRLRTEPEDRLLHRALGPLEDRLHGWLEGL